MDIQIVVYGYTDSSVRQLYKEKKLWSEIKTNPRHSHLIKELDSGEITTNRAIQIIWEAEHEIVDPKKSITNDSEIPNEVRHTTILYEELEGLLDDLHILENSINPPHNCIAGDLKIMQEYIFGVKSIRALIHPEKYPEKERRKLLKWVDDLELAVWCKLEVFNVF